MGVSVLGVTVTCSATSGGATSATFTTGIPGSQSMRFWNSGSVTVFMNYGDSALTAATTSYTPIPAGAILDYDVGRATTASMITSSGSGTVYITPIKVTPN